MKTITQSSANRLSRVLTARHGSPEGGDIACYMGTSNWQFHWRDRNGSQDCFVPEVRIYGLSMTDHRNGGKTFKAGMTLIPQSNWVAVA